MKSKLIFTCVLYCLIGGVFAQPVSGFLGKRMASSLELQIIPGFQGDYEKNTSDFLSYLDYPMSYVPRFIGNFEYQYAKNAAFRGSIGFASMLTKQDFAMPGSSQSFPYSTNTVKTNTVFVQLGVKMGMGKLALPTSSWSIVYGIGIYSTSVPTFTLSQKGLKDATFEGGSKMSLALNVELARRIIFNNGLYLEYGMASSLSSVLLIVDSRSEIYVNDSEANDLLLSAAARRVALNSLFNFKLAVGLFY